MYILQFIFKRFTKNQLCFFLSIFLQNYLQSYLMLFITFYFIKYAKPSSNQSNCFILSRNLICYTYGVFLSIGAQNKMSHRKAFGFKRMLAHILKFILDKKYLKRTLKAPKIPMTPSHDTMTIFTYLPNAFKRLIQSKSPKRATVFKFYCEKATVEPPSAVGRMSDYKYRTQASLG